MKKTKEFHLKAYSKILKKLLKVSLNHSRKNKFRQMRKNIHNLHILKKEMEKIRKK